MKINTLSIFTSTLWACAVDGFHSSQHRFQQASVTDPSPLQILPTANSNLGNVRFSNCIVLPFKSPFLFFYLLKDGGKWIGLQQQKNGNASIKTFTNNTPNGRQSVGLSTCNGDPTLVEPPPLQTLLGCLPGSLYVNPKVCLKKSTTRGHMWKWAQMKYKSRHSQKCKSSRLPSKRLFHRLFYTICSFKIYRSLLLGSVSGIKNGQGTL